MKLLSFVIAFSCIAFGSSMKDEANREHWIYLENDTTHLMADMEIEWGVTYLKNDNKTTVQKMLSFGKDSKLSMNTTEETITIEDSGNTLELNYKLDKGSYWIENVALMYEADTKTFPDAAFNGKVTLSGDMVNLFQSKENSSYLCTMESQTRLNSSEISVTKAYLNFMPSGSAKHLRIQVLSFSTNGSYDNASSCSWDTRDTSIDLQKYVLKKNDKDKSICAMVQTMLSLELSYNMINGKTMQTMIPVKTATDVTGSCEDANVTTMAIALKDKVGTVTLGFEVDTEKMFYYSDVEDAVMNSLQLEYDPATVYFPNHESTGMQTVKNASLCEFKTSIGSSYQCLAMSQVMVTAELTASFNQTKIQAFGIKDGNFSKVDADCQAKPVMNTTTPAKTTQAPTTTTPFIPVPVDPAISERNITDKNNKTCLHGFFGLQLYITYNDTSGKKEEVTYNFDPQNITTQATCNDSNAAVKFIRKDGVEVTLQFMKTKSTSYLYSIEAKYDNKNFPKHNKDKTTAKDLTTMVRNFEVPSNKSYHCSEGTDIFISNADDFVALRLDGLILDVIPMKMDYSPASKCFQDVPQVDAASANFFINNTKSGKTYVCAAFTMTTNAVVMYPQLVDENMRTIYIEVPGNSDTSSDPSSGMCDEKNNSTTLRVPLDDGKVVFFFVFKKQNQTMVLKEATLQYQTDSKYFPNHAHVSGNVSQSNMTLNMFPVAMDHSYKCSKNVTVSLVHGKIFMADVQVQPSGVDKSDGSFSAAKDCASDDLNPIIPIIVGAVLAGLVVIVLIAYVVGRRRNSASSYESL